MPTYNTNFPYAGQFISHLNARHLAAPTVADHATSVSLLFDYLRTVDESYQVNPKLTTITPATIQAFLAWRAATLGLKTTNKKTLSHLRRYFNSLFTHQYNTGLPTLEMTTPVAKPTSVDENWVESIDELVQNDDLHEYTRLCLLGIANFFPPAVQLTPVFHTQLDQQYLTPAQRTFLGKFLVNHKKLQAKQHCPGWMLKHRADIANPYLSMAGLHKYLRLDKNKLPFPLKPKLLYQAAIRHYLIHHPDESNQALCRRLRLSPRSLHYYQRLVDDQQAERNKKPR